ncbi:hypothetical protein M5D96_002196 [Drosophila gunungcola]|uniref:Uncharacterized protein n=1 Tax=Drosophila gunungcola TaxID=103775 RepID=A0A9Q0BVQ7_9MUSC|nr:hypothetical protein M5D96_002196 [Drosophila gunungcola]
MNFRATKNIAAYFWAKRFGNRSAFRSLLIGRTYSGPRTHPLAHAHHHAHHHAHTLTTRSWCCSYKAVRFSFGGTKRTLTCSRTAAAAAQRNHPARTRTRTRTKDKDICFGQQPTTQQQRDARPTAMCATAVMASAP